MQKIGKKTWLLILGAILLTGILLVVAESGVFKSNTGKAREDSVKLETKP